MFDKTDPRASLKNLSDKSILTADIAPAKVVKFYEEDPVTKQDGSKTWWSRGQNFFLSYSDTVEGEVFSRQNQVDEYAVILLDQKTKVLITAGKEEVEVEGNSLIFMPPGQSDIKVKNGGRVVRLFTNLNEDLKDLPLNKEAYASPDENVASFQKWPAPKEGFRIRPYSLDVAKEEGRFGRIFRSTTFMINFLDTSEGPRDPKKMSPHSHDDFEQCSLVTEGEYIHHFRWPWTPNKETWREDSHEHCGSPSTTIIPPGVIHTSEAVGKGDNKLIDIFCPPRMDFSKQDGWVLNNKDYPVE